MTDEDVLDLVRRCNLRTGIELLPGEAYHFKRKFRVNVSGKNRYMQEELIVLVKDGVKVGGIYRMGNYDIHWVMDERYQGRHILSDFLRKGFIERIWPENKSVELCGVYNRRDYEKKRHLAELCHMSIKNEDEIENRLSYFERRR